MDRERWERIDSLLDGALDRPPEERAKWLSEACGGDEALRFEVTRLLELAERDDDPLRPEGVFAGPIGFEVARELERGESARRVDVGDQLGPYRLVEFLGKGGMGQVFAAEDAKLGRRVALKVLPPEMASADRRKRFDREAKAVAALNHPNIVHLYSVEEDNGVPFLTMELVEGVTLGERIPESGLPLKRFFEIALPIVDALASAHDKGIVHRDLKPGNIMIGEDGRIKILDFGLAKIESELGPAFPSPTATSEGHVLGTVSHMSPEQAEGKAIDHRTDIFSLGVVFYEMSTGRLPFTGDSPTAILSSILKDTPTSITDLNSKLPSELARIVKRCLAKDPNRRYQTAVDVRNELEELEYELGSRKLFQPVLARGSRLGLVAGLVVGALAAAAVVFYLASRVQREPSVDLLKGSFSQLTALPGAELFPTLSPDGGFLAYCSRESGNWDVYLLRAGGERAINLTERSPADDVQPVFSPDGQQIAFRSSREDGGLFVMGATGESARRLTTFGWNPSWSPDGETLVFASEAISRTPFDRPTTSVLWTVGVGDGALNRLYEGDAVQPSWSPHGHRIAFWALVEGARRDIFTIPADGGEPVAVTQDAAVDWNPVWSPDGRFLYFSSDRGGSMNLWRVPIDESSGRTSGEPEPVRTPSTFATHMSFSREGTRMVYASMLSSQTLDRAPFDPATATVGPLSKSSREVRNVASPRVSPDGEWMAYTREGGQEDIVVARLDGSEPRLVTDDPANDRYPRWTPDGSRIAFYSNRGGTYEIWSVKPDGGDLRQDTDIPEHPTRYPIFSPDGTKLLFSAPGVTGMLIDPRRPWSEQTPERLPDYPAERSQFVPLDWSPDGKWVVAYLQSLSGLRSGIAVYSVEDGTFETIVDFGNSPFWLSDSRRILFQGLGPGRARDPAQYETDYKLYVADRATKEYEEVLAIPGSSLDAPVLSPDNRTLVFVRTAFEADIWMLSAPETERPPSSASF